MSFQSCSVGHKADLLVGSATFKRFALDAAVRLIRTAFKVQDLTANTSADTTSTPTFWQAWAKLTSAGARVSQICGDGVSV